MNAPIVVTGMGRSGLTWMQWLLSQHHNIHIHGQNPNLPWSELWNWHETLKRQGQWAQRINRQCGYQVRYFAGSDAERTREVFAGLLKGWLTGFGPAKPRWGFRWEELCADPEAVYQLETLWPQARWVVCIRDPFQMIQSAKNTSAPGLDPEQAAANWVRACKFAESHDPARVVAIQLDRLRNACNDRRKASVQKVLRCLGEAPSDSVQQFVRHWPLVERIQPESRRSFVLSDETKQRLIEEVPDLLHWMRRLGYLAPELAKC